MQIRRSKQRFSWILASLLILSTQSWADSSVHYHHSGAYFGDPGTGEAMVFDAVIIRPLGLVTTVAGSAIYTISLPFSLLGGNEQSAREKLVLEPARYTFKRPLGEYEY